ncbi:uncharacterized protein [Mycetomoellerius zeteki]|uniref:uncharacterized protein n=1 Tax=Mycetomoellerius zeteki TaxID=64791 RepID=UPI00084EACCD|nr:PREDICTED: uncharacterized protein LOC108731911 [Trachymyrmex zeteki]
MAATGAMLIAYLKHICGMFSIASFRIKKAINMQQNVNEEKMVIIYKRIICAIDIHRKATEFSQVFIKNFEGSFFCLIGAGMVCLTSTLVQIISYNSIEQLVLSLIYISTLWVYMFLSNYIAQDITDHNEYVFATIYNVEWYVAPLHIQKVMLFLLQKGTKAFHLILGGIFIASMESAATNYLDQLKYSH